MARAVAAYHQSNGDKPITSDVDAVAAAIVQAASTPRRDHGIEWDTAPASPSPSADSRTGPSTH